MASIDGMLVTLNLVGFIRVDVIALNAARRILSQ